MAYLYTCAPCGRGAHAQCERGRPGSRCACGCNGDPNWRGAWYPLAEDPRPARHGWAPGEYMNNCKGCGCAFIGDKRAWHCADCAYALPDPAPQPAPNPALAAALALVETPSQKADLDMLDHCKLNEDVDRAAARILAAELRRVTGQTNQPL